MLQLPLHEQQQLLVGRRQGDYFESADAAILVDVLHNFVLLGRNRDQELARADESRLFIVAHSIGRLTHKK